MSSPWGVALGTDASGVTVTRDISAAPHVLLCGTSGSGKSVGVHAIIAGLVAAGSPADTRITVLDPKRVEFGIWRDAPHVDAVVTDRAAMLEELQGLVREMDTRYAAMERAGVADIAEWHGTRRQLPRLFLVCDELADLTMSGRDKASKLYAAQILGALTRIAQLGRAAGIHLVVATQRPAADTLPGNLRANLGTRWAFRVRTRAESRIALDAPGAETLGTSPGTSLVSWRGAQPGFVQCLYVARGDVAGHVEAAIARWGCTGRRRAQDGWSVGSAAALVFALVMLVGVAVTAMFGGS